jgi:hypothetical protein
MDVATVSAIRAGAEFYAPTMRTFITVTRVARDKTWADLHVMQPATGYDWKKRQPLIDGAFGFPVEPATP